MTVTQPQAQMLAELARACRPTGARRWDTPGILAAIKQVADRDLAEVIMAVIRAAADRDVETPGVIPSNGSHWQESAAVRSYVPHIIAPEHRCGICSKAREKCARERVADDDHVFEPATSKPPQIDVTATVAALKAEVAPTATPPPTRTLAERVAELPTDPGMEAVRATLREAETCGHPNHGGADHDCAPFQLAAHGPGVETAAPVAAEEGR